jgi:crotonobetainyl-CoA:carnitine CoA-transferase CaiB-like acyl-CoA transferase
MKEEERQILKGIRILDIGTMIAGPMTCTLLADFGAEVIKVERPEGGDPLRQIGPFVKNDSLYWSLDDRKKKLITTDFHKEAAHQCPFRRSGQRGWAIHPSDVGGHIHDNLL